MTKSNNNPLVTFVVIAYNQERFVREAIESAFSQTYDPLEIILSDDASTDATYNIMQDMAASYGGPHRVLLNQNPSNLGIVPHIDHVMEMLSGEFIVVNAGDDVSVPKRTSTLVKRWLDSGRSLRLLHSAATRIDLNGVPHDLRRPPSFMQGDPGALDIIQGKGYVIGATAAWDKILFTEFGPLGKDLSVEDTVLPFRAAIIGGIGFIDLPLIKWRDGGVSQQGSKFDFNNKLYGFKLKSKSWLIDTYLHILKSPALARSGHGREIQDACLKLIPNLQFSVDLAGAGFVRRLWMFPRAVYLSYQGHSLCSIKRWLVYTLDFLYIAIGERLRVFKKNYNGRSKAKHE